MYRVLHVFDHSLPLHSGYAFRSRAILREQAARGWTTLQVTGAKQGSGAQRSEDVDGLTFHRTPPGRLMGLPWLGQLDVVRGLRRRLEELIEAHRPQLLHAHSPALNGLAALGAAKRARLPVVYEVRAFWEDAAVDLGTTSTGSLRYRLTRAMETHVVRKVEQVVCICDGLRDDLLERGLPADKVRVVGNAVDVSTFTFRAPRDEALAARLRLGDGPVLGFIGSFYAYEGIDLLLRALPRIAVTHPGVRALLVGGGPRESALHDLARELGVADRVSFTGRVPHSEVSSYATLVDAFVFARQAIRLTDLVTPLKPLEAMAQGVLVVASDVGGHRELIRDRETGFLFRAGDVAALASTVVDALGDPARCERVRLAGRRFVETERSWPTTTATYADVYADALRAAGAVAPDGVA
ncbi:MAG: glycosyltransferase, exosortase A system-associated [Planctomycetes bacterium]|nr:glycosyltransferase, exosortase A system-associated [Planctomycetota bacterium]